MNVYAVTDGEGNYKIGMANNVFTRLNQLQTGNPKPLTVTLVVGFEYRYDALEVERGAQRWLKNKGQHLLNEWFSCTTYQAHEAVKCGCCGADTSGHISIEEMV